MVNTRYGLRALCALLIPALVAGCLDGPFARLNPNDPGADIALTLVASRDTLRPATPYVVLQVLSDPATHSYKPMWSMEPAGSLIDLGDGVFWMPAAPVATAPTTIYASFQTRTLSFTVVRAP